jgi:hypothetical protein
MTKHTKLRDVIEANELLMSMGGTDQLPTIASSAIERSLELQHRVDRAIRYAEQSHTSSLHARQMLRILDGSITIDDELNEVLPEPIVHQKPLDEYPRLVRQPLTAPAPRQEGGLGGRSTAQRKAFREWCAEQDIDLPLNKTVPQHLIDDFDEATNGIYKPVKTRSHHKPDTSPRGKLKPGHGLAGRSDSERLHIREWLTQQGFDVNPFGRIPQNLINHYDAAMAELKRMQREGKQQRQEEQPQEQQPDAQDQHAQGA